MSQNKLMSANQELAKLSANSATEVLTIGDVYSPGKERTSGLLDAQRSLSLPPKLDGSNSLIVPISNPDEEDQAAPETDQSVQIDSQLDVKLPAEDDIEKDLSKCCVCWIRSRGLILAILSSVLFALAAYTAFYLTNIRNFEVSILVIIRFASIFFLALAIVPFLIRNQLEVFSTMDSREQKFTVLMIFLRAVFGVSSGTLHVYALNYISPADASVVLYSNPIIVALGARLFLNEKMSICQTITALLAIIGVFIISKPPFLAGKRDFDSDQLIGIAFAVGATLTLTAVMILVRRLRGVHFSILNTVFGLTGVITGVVLGLAGNGLVRNEETHAIDVFILVIAGASLSGGVICLTLALRFEKAGLVAVARSSEVIFSFLWQINSGIYPDALRWRFFGITKHWTNGILQICVRP
ncbi:unnamed protein product [Allacma fusca]|uniref:EamA domain-containing protein n=1 Tax=Allacma fusca TaxID=39272 RepID=A0A8J2LA73_9HEXA|nr:unnamed protein product [Allacma fusca]